jgi:hypothetical protein
VKRIFSLFVLALSLGYVVPLFPLPWANGGVGTEARFMHDSWGWGLGLLVFNLVGSVLLVRLKKGWTLCALCFCIMQVSIWWLLSGLFATNGNFIQFLNSKWNAVWSMLQYPDYRVRFVTFHQDIAMGVFYHIGMLWIALESLSKICRRRVPIANEP